MNNNAYTWDDPRKLATNDLSATAHPQLDPTLKQATLLKEISYKNRGVGACTRCRSRRLKCDQGTPICSPCLRAQIESCEYEELLNLVFRDQTDKTIRKAKQCARKKHTTSLRANENMTQSALSIMSPQESLQYPIKQLAKPFFFANYVSAECGGYMSFLKPHTQDLHHSALDDAMGAVGLAALSNLRLCPLAVLQARRYYTAALSHTNLALQDPGNAKKDDLLAAVVLLAMFEVTTCSDASSLDRWMRHVDGATRMIEICGTEQLATESGLALFDFLRPQISISTIYREQHSSSAISQLTEIAGQHRASHNQLGDHLSSAVTRLGDLFATLKTGPVLQTSTIIRKALNLDAEFASLLLDVPASWIYTTIEVPRSDGDPFAQTVWGNYYHVYQSAAASAAWNNYRSARLLLHELILTIVSDMKPVDDASRDQRCALINQTQQTATQLIECIFASVPFQFGPATVNKSHTIKGLLRPGCPMTLIWPLSVAANSGFVSENHRKWITWCLDKIGHSTGINQALAMAQLLRNGSDLRAYLLR